MMLKKKVFIIAEAGVNHNGSLSLAKKMIDAAADAGADAIKFQTFDAGRLVSKNAAKAEYQKKTTSPHESQYEMLRRLQLSTRDHSELIAYSKKKGVIFLSSPFDEKSADLLEKLGVNQFKIPSGEITNIPFLSHVAKKMKPIILSTGMSTLGDIEEALDIIYSTGNRHVQLLHCVTEYPAPCREINLRAMMTMKNAFDIPVGYSDHALGNEIAIAAVALGAEIIEKHFTLDKNMDGPDHKASLEPEEFKEMVAAIRNVEMAMGDGIKKPAPCEIKNMAIARKSVVAARPIKKNEKITQASVTIKRPGNGIQPHDLVKIIGRRVKRDIEADEIITWSNLQ